MLLKLSFPTVGLVASLVLLVSLRLSLVPLWSPLSCGRSRRRCRRRCRVTSALVAVNRSKRATPRICADHPVSTEPELDLCGFVELIRHLPSTTGKKCLQELTNSLKQTFELVDILHQPAGVSLGAETPLLHQGRAQSNREVLHLCGSCPCGSAIVKRNAAFSVFELGLLASWVPATMFNGRYCVLHASLVCAPSAAHMHSRNESRNPALVHAACPKVH